MNLYAPRSPANSQDHQQASLQNNYSAGFVSHNSSQNKAAEIAIKKDFLYKALVNKDSKIMGGYCRS